MSLLFIVAMIAGLFQTQPQRPAASIEGIVVKLGTSEPLGDASVQLNEEASENRRKTKSDGNGRFIFDNVAPGEYRLIATSDGPYVPAEYGQRSPTGQGIPFKIAAGQKMTGIQLAMSPTGAISGRIYDRDGEPLGKAQVLALRPVYKNGHRTLTIVQSVVSDDRGEYRLYWLAPGTYYVAAKPDVAEFPMNMGQPNSYSASMVHITPPTRFGTYEQTANPVIHNRRLKTGEVVEEMYLPVYYPKTLDAHAASPLSVTGGATVGGVDIATEVGLMTPHHIRGRAFDQAGRPVAGASLMAIPRTMDPYVVTPHAQSAADGTFDIPGVTPGSYQVFANIAGESRTLNGIATVEALDRDIQIAPIVMTPDFNLSGRFTMEDAIRPGNPGRNSFPQIRELTRDPEIVGMPSGFPSFTPPSAADGSFTVEGVVTGDFRVTLMQLPADGYVKSMRMGNVDALNDGLHISSAPVGLLEIVIGANAGGIEGSVVDTRNRPLTNRTVVLVPDRGLRQRADLYRVVSTDDAGGFRMQNITPGDYKLFAWENVETGAWQDPDFIQSFEGNGRAVRISEGSNEQLQLAVIP